MSNFETARLVFIASSKPILYSALILIITTYIIRNIWRWRRKAVTRTAPLH